MERRQKFITGKCQNSWHFQEIPVSRPPQAKSNIIFFSPPLFGCIFLSFHCVVIFWRGGVAKVTVRNSPKGSFTLGEVHGTSSPRPLLIIRLAIPSKSEGREWGVGWIMVGFQGFFGAPRFSVQRSQNPLKYVFCRGNLNQALLIGF